MTTEAVNDRQAGIIEAMKANETQVGGQHYKSEYQHWDFVNDFRLDYFEGCATKYVTRRKGNRIEDLRKARHFLTKVMEISTPQGITLAEPLKDKIETFCLANKLTVRENLFLVSVVSRNYVEAIKHLDALIEEERF